MTSLTASRLSDAALVAEVTRLARREREATADLIAHLAELDARRLYLGAGFPSLFTYCVEVLQLSEHETYNRIEAARAVRKCPAILERLGRGALNLTSVRLLAPHLTDEDGERLVVEACGKSKREVEELVARRFPRPATPESIRKLPAPRQATPAAIERVTEILSCPPDAPVPAAPLPAKARQVLTPLAADRYEIRFTAPAGTCEKLRRAKDLLRHTVPSGDTAEIIDRALSALLEQIVRNKLAMTTRQGVAGGTAEGSRHIPAQVKRAVWLRDGERCAFVGQGGRRCAARGFLEFHHVKPYAVGGPPTVGNIQLRCRSHNAYEAELFYGARDELVPERVGCHGESGRAP
jgi:hypothetical protein